MERVKKIFRKLEKTSKKREKTYKKIRGRKLYLNYISKKKKKKIIPLLILVIIILVIVLIKFCFFRVAMPKNVLVSNTNFHEIEVQWNYSKEVNDYVVILSYDKISRDDVIDDLDDGQIDGDFDVVDADGETDILISDVLSNYDYYIVVVGYYEKGNVKKYLEPSKVVKIHTDSLDVSKVENLEIGDVSDESISLKWSSWSTSTKNLDGMDVEVTYSVYSISQNDDDSVLIVDNLEVTEYTITDLDIFTEYFYKVVVNVKVDGKVVVGDDSDIIDAMTKKESVSSVNVEVNGTSELILTWDSYDKIDFKNDDDSDVDITYSVFASDSKDGKYEKIAENLSDCVYKESDLSDNQTRYYYVIANFKWNDESYETAVSDIVSGTTEVTQTYSSNNYSSTTSSSSSSKATDEKYAEALVVARQIANSITGSTDYEKIQQATAAVYEYVSKATYVSEGDDYYTAYGVFIKGECTCAGATRALGMVLECMGYSWKHANENQWTHQWVIVNIDGQVGWADPSFGFIGYGEHP